MTEKEIKKIYYPIAKSWELIKQFIDCSGTDEECQKLSEIANHIYEVSGRTKFSKEIISSTVDEIDRIMKENRSSCNGKYSS